MKVFLEQCNLKFFADIEGRKMNVPHPGILAKIVEKGQDDKFLFFWWTSSAKENGIKVKNKQGEVFNSFVCTEANVRTKIKSLEDLRKAISYYTEKGQRRYAENLKIGDLIEFQDPNHRSEFNRNVPVFKKSNCFKKTVGFLKEDDVKKFYKKIALFLSKNVYNFYESPNMFGIESVNGTSPVTLTDEEINNLIEEMKKRSL